MASSDKLASSRHIVAAWRPVCSSWRHTWAPNWLTPIQFTAKSIKHSQFLYLNALTWWNSSFGCFRFFQDFCDSGGRRSDLQAIVLIDNQTRWFSGPMVYLQVGIAPRDACSLTTDNCRHGNIGRQNILFVRQNDKNSLYLFGDNNANQGTWLSLNLR